MGRLRAALVDVGGTLWVSRPWTPAHREVAVERLAALLPGVARDVLEGLRAGLREAAARHSGERVQDADGDVRAVATRLGLRLDRDTPRAVREAVSLPAVEVATVMEGAGDMLRRLRDLGLRTVIVSNTDWRDAEIYRRDLAGLGLAGLLDAIVTSVDVGRRKPDPAVFAVAIEQAGCEARDCVMIGDLEEKDVLPALALGMRAVRVVVGATGPVMTTADAAAGSLREAAAAVCRWCAEA
jgi:HAD superfamily hydrolase (TIGR01509 family)